MIFSIKPLLIWLDFDPPRIFILSFLSIEWWLRIREFVTVVANWGTLWRIDKNQILSTQYSLLSQQHPNPEWHQLNWLSFITGEQCQGTQALAFKIFLQTRWWIGSPHLEHTWHSSPSISPPTSHRISIRSFIHFLAAISEKNEIWVFLFLILIDQWTKVRPMIFWKLACNGLLPGTHLDPSFDWIESRF